MVFFSSWQASPSMRQQDLLCFWVFPAGMHYSQKGHYVCPQKIIFPQRSDGGCCQCGGSCYKQEIQDTDSHVSPCCRGPHMEGSAGLGPIAQHPTCPHEFSLWDGDPKAASSNLNSAVYHLCKHVVVPFLFSPENKCSVEGGNCYPSKHGNFWLTSN